MVLEKVPIHEDEWFIIEEMRFRHRAVSRRILAWSSTDRAEAELYLKQMQNAEHQRLVDSGAVDPDYGFLTEPEENYHYSLAHAKDLRDIDFECRAEED